jgi:hypothetical protein
MATLSAPVALARGSLAPECRHLHLETMSLVRVFALLVLGLVATRWALARQLLPTRQWLPDSDPFVLDWGVRSCCAGGM